MTNQELFSYVDHTALKAFTTWAEISKCPSAEEMVPV